MWTGWKTESCWFSNVERSTHSFQEANAAFCKHLWNLWTHFGTDLRWYIQWYTKITSCFLQLCFIFTHLAIIFGYANWWYVMWVDAGIAPVCHILSCAEQWTSSNSDQKKKNSKRIQGIQDHEFPVHQWISDICRQLWLEFFVRSASRSFTIIYLPPVKDLRRISRMHLSRCRLPRLCQKTRPPFCDWREWGKTEHGLCSWIPQSWGKLPYSSEGMDFLTYWWISNFFWCSKLRASTKNHADKLFFDYVSGSSVWVLTLSLRIPNGPTVETPRERAFGMVFMDQRGSWYSQLLAPPDLIWRCL